MYQEQHEAFITELNQILEGAEDIYAEVCFSHVYVEWFRYGELQNVSVRSMSGDDFQDLAQAAIRLVRDKDSDETRIKILMDQLMNLEVR